MAEKGGYIKSVKTKAGRQPKNGQNTLEQGIYILNMYQQILNI